MSVVEYLSYLHGLDVVARVEGDHLSIEGPKESLTPGLIREIRARKQEILAFFKETSSDGASPIPKAARGGRIPLALPQQRMWFLHQFAAGEPLYNIKKSFRLLGSLDRHALQQALDGLVARHEALRTRFVSFDGEPMQVIDPPRAVPLRELDWSGRDRSDIERDLLPLLRTEARKSYDLSAELMLRALLIRLKEDEHVLFLGLHHIAADGWSLSILLRDFSQLYSAARNGTVPALPELPVQYADYGAWLHSRYEGEALTREVEFWRERLEGVPPLELPDRPCASETLRGGYQPLKLSKEVTAAVKALARSEHVTIYTVLLAAFNALLHRYSGQTDLIMGSPVANRNRREVEPLVGLFVSTLVIRTDVSGNPTFRELIRRVQHWMLDTLSHTEVPFEQLDVWGRGEQRNGSLLRTLFVFQNLPKSRFQLEGLKIERMPSLGVGVAKFDLSLTMRERPPLLSGGFSFSIDRFERETVARMAEHFATYIASAVVDPDRPIGSIPLVDPRQRSKADEGRTSDAPIKKYCVHELLEAQAALTPEAVALTGYPRGSAARGAPVPQRLTYSELANRTSELALVLRAKGIGRGAVVGLCMDREPALVVALLAILKAGAAYLPLDPNYPAERLALMVEDAKPQLLVTTDHLRGRVLQCDVELLCLESLRQVVPTAGFDEGSLWDDLAYVIYTSGSAGRPKGVMVEHRSLSNLAQQAVKLYELTSADRVLQFASVSFDASAEEIFPTLAAGGAVVMCDPSSFASMTDFVAYCDDHGVTVLDLPTAFWHELVDYLDAAGAVLPDSVRLVVIGGEAAQPEKVATWFRRTDTRLVNSYGPTEATVTATVCELRSDESSGRVPIGKPIGNASTYVLDPYMNPVPPGVGGELYLGGMGIARGYLGRPDLTAERFIRNPFGRDRLYRTGDLVLLRDDGLLEFLGRKDDQVKIRGFRVELGEIESVARQHPEVRNVAVRLWRTGRGRTKLAAYFTAQEGARIDENELRRFVGRKLPDYMVPSTCVRVESIPTLPGGKIDRRALPDPETGLNENFAEPVNETEERLARIWSDVLGVKRVGTNDNFFELGGHSLLIMRILARVRETFQREVSVRSMFEAPTIAEFARALTSAPDQPSEPARIASSRNRRRMSTSLTRESQ